MAAAVAVAAEESVAQEMDAAALDLVWSAPVSEAAFRRALVRQGCGTELSEELVQRQFKPRSCQAAADD